ncbi:SDR family NAD(P)-dependent oxidoreductase [Rathayibacter sp. CAU 1779]
MPAPVGSAPAAQAASSASASLGRLSRDRFAGTNVLITGASDGIGLEIARWIASAGGRILMPVRNRVKGEGAAARIRESVPDARITLYDLDLADLGSTRELAEVLRAEGEPIQHYVMNAGIVLLGDRARHVTADGFELHFQTNFLGHVALTEGILPLLEAGRARVAAQASLEGAHGGLAWDDLQGERSYGPLSAYRMSKIALGLYATELQRRDGAARGISVRLCHPGVAPATAIAAPIRALLPRAAVDAVTRSLGNSARQGALTAVAALAADAPAPAMYAPSRWFGVSGPPRRRPLFRTMADAAEAQRIWNIAFALLGDSAS